MQIYKLKMKDKQTFIADYLTKHMANHNLPYGGAYFNLLADTEIKAEKAYKQYVKKHEIEKLQKEKEIYGHAHTQDELLIRELWTLWENLAEAGELTITSKFATKYNELKAKIK